jgi:hypothetical protein
VSGMITHCMRGALWCATVVCVCVLKEAARSFLNFGGSFVCGVHETTLGQQHTTCVQIDRQ